MLCLAERSLILRTCQSVLYAQCVLILLISATGSIRARGVGWRVLADPVPGVVRHKAFTIIRSGRGDVLYSSLAKGEVRPELHRSSFFHYLNDTSRDRLEPAI